METSSLNIEVYKYSPQLFTKIDYANSSRNYSYVEKELVVNQSIFKKGTKFNVSCSPALKSKQVKKFTEKYMTRVSFKNLKNNETFTKYSYDNEFEIPKVTGDYKLIIDFIGKDKYNNVNLINSRVKII